MITSLLLTAAVFRYTLPAAPIAYQVKISYEGFIPVFGGQEGKFLAEMGVSAQSLPADADGNPQAASEVKSLKIWFNDAELPFGVETIQNFFPRTTISHSLDGKILKTNAPNVAVPVKLPGLDVKRFPDISYMPVEFPLDALEVGKAWTYRKKFGESEVVYTATPKSITDKELVVSLTAAQEYEVLEDDQKQVVADESKAIARVKTTLAGQGSATFDLEKGILTKMELSGLASSEVKDLKSGVSSKRELKSGLEILLKR